eukprot:scaffold137882_cov72-Phaeocystis_antarctica.AAC.1
MKQSHPRSYVGRFSGAARCAPGGCGANPPTWHVRPLSLACQPRGRCSSVRRRTPEAYPEECPVVQATSGCPPRPPPPQESDSLAVVSVAKGAPPVRHLPRPSGASRQQGRGYAQARYPPRRHAGHRAARVHRRLAEGRRRSAPERQRRPPS